MEVPPLSPLSNFEQSSFLCVDFSSKPDLGHGGPSGWGPCVTAFRGRGRRFDGDDVDVLRVRWRTKAPRKSPGSSRNRHRIAER